jgi:uncharacterized damage-inducible protein DinB
MNTDQINLTIERHDFLESLSTHRKFLKFAVRDLTDEQARLCPTASELCLGGLVKHVALVEEGWANFILHGPEAIGHTDEAAYEAHANGFRMSENETLAGLLERYDAVAKHTDEIVASLESFDLSHRLPDAPWFESGASWSARRVIVHIVAETAQHAGHADIIRESIDGSRTMG